MRSAGASHRHRRHRACRRGHRHRARRPVTAGSASVTIRRAWRCTVLAVAAMVMTCSEAWAWGPQGHSTVGAIADQLLAGTPAEPKLRALLLPGETLAQVANWADCVKGPRVC